jgi:hypothetical protein
MIVFGGKEIVIEDLYGNLWDSDKSGGKSDKDSTPSHLFRLDNDY